METARTAALRAAAKRWIFAGAVFASASGTALAMQVSGRAEWVQNISRTSEGGDLKDGARQELSLNWATHRQLSRSWQADAFVTGAYENWSEFSAMDSVRLMVGASAERKFGLGPYAPSIAFDVSADYADLRENGRSRLGFDGGARVFKRFTPAWFASAGFGWTEHYAEARPFDVRHHHFRIETSYDLTERWRFTVGASRLWGELTANARGSTWSRAIGGDFGSVISNYYNTLAWHVTDTFGPGWVAYRIHGSADTWWVGVSPALTDATSASLRYERSEVTNRIRIGYETEIWSLSLVHRF